MNKLILGTAQLNERYGVLNLKKKTKQEIFQFLEYCFDKGIKNYDTAEGYNNQKLLGEFFKFNKKSVKPIVLTKIGKLNHRGRSNKKKLDLLKIKLDKIIKDLSVIPNTVLFHDIGDPLAPYSHSEMAAAILRPFVSEKIYWVVRHHGVFQMYYYAHHSGGDRNAREAFIDNPWYDDAVKFCHDYDQNCFDPNYESKPLEFFCR